MAMMEGLCPGPLLDSFSNNIPENLSTLQGKAEKYIVVEELVEAKQRRRGRDDKRKKLDTKQADYRDEARNKGLDQDSRLRTNDRCPRTPSTAQN